MADKLVEAIPELTPAYEKELEWWRGEEPLRRFRCLERSKGGSLRKNPQLLRRSFDESVDGPSLTRGKRISTATLRQWLSSIRSFFVWQCTHGHQAALLPTSPNELGSLRIQLTGLRKTQFAAT
jgi:hypothetical protein